MTGHLPLRKPLGDREAPPLAERLLALGVPAGPVRDIPSALAHPHTRHRGMVIEEDGYRGIATPIKLSRTPGGLTSIPPQLGADARAVLAEAGYGPAEIERLIAEGVVPLPERKAAE